MFLNHETNYRSAAAMARIAVCPVTICGAGSIGGNLAQSLARQGFRRLTVIDFDRVEAANLGGQPYGRGDVGALKVDALARAIFRSVGVEVRARKRRLDADNTAHLLRGARVVVDCFDNSAARSAVQRAVKASGQACLHVGLAVGYAELVWEPDYTVPSDDGMDPCGQALARNLVLMAVAAAGELLIAEAVGAPRRSLSITLGDLKILPFGEP